MSLVGQSIPQIDGRAKVTGSTPYIGNIEVPGMLYGKILRSPFPHARIVGLDTTKAKQYPGVIKVLTGQDIPKLGFATHYGLVFQDQPILAIDKVRYVGEPVAAVAAVNPEVADLATDLIEVEYEELPAVFDPVSATKVNAPKIHDSLTFQQTSFANPSNLHPEDLPNSCTHFILRRGHADIGFANADYVFDMWYSSPYQQHCNLEPHTTIVSYHSHGVLEVWSSTQNPSIIRDGLSQITGMPSSRIRVHALPLGAGYGSKLYLKLEPITAAMAVATKQPIKISLTREESFFTAAKHGCQVHIQTALMDEGTIIARKVEAYYDTGAYADIGPHVVKNGGYTSAGPYNIPNLSIDAYCVYTNKMPAGAFRGFGLTQVCWAYEQEMDRIAHELHLDPIEFRRKNLLRNGDSFATGQILEGVACEEALDAVVQSFNHEKKRTVINASRNKTLKRGRGFSVCIKSTMTPSISQAAVRLEEDGSLTVLVSSVEMGQGLNTAMTQIAADLLALPAQKVRLSEPDTQFTPYDQGTCSGRTIFSMGNAVADACKQIRDELLFMAAKKLEISQDDLEIVDGSVQVKGAPSRRLYYDEVLRSHFGIRGGVIFKQGCFSTKAGLDPHTGQGTASAFWFTGAAGIDIEVDTETGCIRVVKCVSAANVGKAINPELCRAQIQGSVGMGLGMALFEEMIFDQGQPINPNFLDYRLTTIYEAPLQMESILIEKPHPNQPFGAIGVGETALPTVAPALSNAIFNAIGVRITDLPITPEKILWALKQKS